MITTYELYYYDFNDKSYKLHSRYSTVEAVERSIKKLAGKYTIKVTRTQVEELYSLSKDDKEFIKNEMDKVE